MKLDIIIGYLLDLLLGDPTWLPHPVRLIGKFISIMEEKMRKKNLSAEGMKKAGILLVLLTVGLTYLITWGILRLALFFSPLAHLIISAVIIYFALASRSLVKEAKKIYYALVEKDINLARKRLSYIVGRDTEKLKQSEIIRATVETVAENISDGIIAPMFYIFLGGPALGMAYKAVNTLDSMVGYKNEKYQDLGWAAAKFDDLVNWLPARITGYMIPLIGAIIGRDGRRGYKTLQRDCRKHTSPNAGYPEAAVAGVLGVQLGGTNYYFGQAVEKPTIGDAVKPLEVQDITETTKITLLTSALGLVFFYLFAIKGFW